MKTISYEDYRSFPQTWSGNFEVLRFQELRIWWVFLPMAFVGSTFDFFCARLLDDVEKFEWVKKWERFQMSLKPMWSIFESIFSKQSTTRTHKIFSCGRGRRGEKFRYRKQLEANREATKKFITLYYFDYVNFGFLRSPLHTEG